MERILRAIQGFQYSIHDLSRCRGEGDGKLARLDMPHELGMAMVERFSMSIGVRRHDWPSLMLLGHAHGRFMPGLSAYDRAEHDGNPESVVAAAVMQPIPISISRPSVPP